MKIIVNGAAGHMGKVLLSMIEAGTRGAELAAAVDAFAPGQGILGSLDAFEGTADCIVDFSHHSATKVLTDYAVTHRIPLVIATTGQTAEEQAMIEAASASIPVFASGNMSMGIALLTELAKTTARMFPDADIEIVEAHHNRKIDVPSGTALMLANACREARPDSHFNIGRHENGRREKSEIGIHSLRMGNTVGIHEVIVNTGSQVITLKHEAQDRSLFAEGALAAADFILNKAPGLYSVQDIVSEA